MMILLDVDGVVAEFTGHLLKTIGSDLTLADITTWEIQSHVTKEQWADAKAVLSSAEWWLGIPTMDGAIDGVNRIRAAGHDIHWVTSPWWSCYSWESERRWWLQNRFGAKPNDITFTNRKELLTAGDVLIDDKPSHILNWLVRKKSGIGILYDAPYNQGVTGVNRMTWDNIPKELI